MSKIVLIVALLAAGMTHAGGSVVAGGFDEKGIEISLSDPGDGIDLATEEKLLAIVASRLRGGRLAKVTTAIVGFEGDITYCLEFQNSSLMSAAFPAIDDLVRQGKNVSGKTISACK